MSDVGSEEFDDEQGSLGVSGLMVMFDSQFVHSAAADHRSCVAGVWGG